jgi:hypothetical protein
MHGVFLAHVGMRVRLTAKFNATLGLVQEQKATIVDFLFHDADVPGYKATSPGCLFKPRLLPAAVVLQIDAFTGSPMATDFAAYFAASGVDDDDEDEAADADDTPKPGSIFLLRPTEQPFKWRNSQIHHVRRVGFQLTHALYLTSTAAQGQTLRTGVTLDCARYLDGLCGMQDAEWWLHLYVMFSRVTRMSDMLLLRPPPRSFLERGPPAGVRAALSRFAGRAATCRSEATELARLFGM